MKLFALVGFAGFFAFDLGAQAKPPEPFVDNGACPFEGCVYRDWIATEVVSARVARRENARVAFTVKKGERVRALSGVVITTKAGRVEFLKAMDIQSNSGKIHIEPNETLFLLTYQGEGFMKVWLKGKVYDGVEVVLFYDEICTKDPQRCGARLVAEPVCVWWVKIRNRRGQVGWIDQPSKFDNKDALARSS
ncbi:MAG TPA: hypothetical protein VM099_10200 [Gemmatimonadaceae bacterium]|nr:hypothetical protein [Gemmatimonadaceae bacterium]